MKNVICILGIFMGLSFISCSSEETWEELEAKENVVVYEVICSDANATVHLSDLLYHPSIINVSSGWRGEVTSNSYSAPMTMQCDDPYVLMTGRIYVNGKLREERSGTSYVQVSCKLK